MMSSIQVLCNTNACLSPISSPPPPPPSLASSSCSKSNSADVERTHHDNDTKRPFLRKGSRREPSALHRLPKQIDASKSTSKNTPKSRSSSSPVRPPPLPDFGVEVKQNYDPRSDIVKKYFSSPISGHDNLSGPVTVRSNCKENDHIPSLKCTPSNTQYSEKRDIASINTKPMRHSFESSQIAANVTFASKGENNLVTDNTCTQSSNEVQHNQLKRIQKRQEVALVEAERIRESARSWAATERATVTQWANEQRNQIEKQRKLLKQDELLIQKASNERITKKKKEMEIEALRATIEKMKLDEETKTKRFKSEERRYKMRIRKLEDNLRSLQNYQKSVEALEIKDYYCHSHCNDIERNDQFTQTEDVKGQTYYEEATNEESSSTPDEKDVSNSEHSVGFVEASKFTSECIKLQNDDNEQSDGHVDDCTDSSQSAEVSKHASHDNELDPESFIHIIEGSNALVNGEETQLWLNGAIDPSYQENGVKTANCGHEPIDAYHGATSNDDWIPKQEVVTDRTEHLFPDGRKTILYRNGTYKEIGAGGNQITIRYINGDVQTSYNDRNLTVYFYAASNVSEIVSNLLISDLHLFLDLVSNSSRRLKQAILMDWKYMNSIQQTK